MYRLKVKQGKRWRNGRVEYPTILAAQTRQLELELLGIRSKVCDFTGKEIDENGSCTN